MRGLLEVVKSVFPDAEVPAGALEIGSVDGWDSVGNFNLLLAIEEEYGVQFSVEDVGRLRSLSDMATALIALGVEVEKIGKTHI